MQPNEKYTIVRILRLKELALTVLRSRDPMDATVVY